MKAGKDGTKDKVREWITENDKSTLILSTERTKTNSRITRERKEEEKKKNVDAVN